MNTRTRSDMLRHKKLVAALDMADAEGPAATTAGALLDGIWYEDLLAQEERRRLGHYSTPPDLVARMLAWVGYQVEANLEHLMLLDPSCGSGNFLAAAAQTLIAHGQARGWPALRTLRALQANLWGLETDPVACALADLRLRALARRLMPQKRLKLHIHQVDALALAARPRFQVVIGNPPYLSSRKHHLHALYHGYLSSGQCDAYLLFLEQACRFVTPGGWLGLVLPDPVLVRANAADVRSLLRELFTVKQLLHVAGVFRAEVGTLVLIAQRVPCPASFQVAWNRLHWRRGAQGAGSASGAFAVDIWRRQPRAELRYLLGPAEQKLFERLAREVPSPPLGDLVQISRGEELARHAVRPAAVDEEREALFPVLRGGLDVRPFRCRFAGVYLHRNQITKPLERYLAPKLLVVKSTAMLSAALDEQHYVALQTLYLLHLKTDQVLAGYVLALLNSRLLRGYLWLYHTAYKLVQPQIEQDALARVPVPLVSLAQQREIAVLAGQLQKRYLEVDRMQRDVQIGRSGGIACANEAAWIQLQRDIHERTACLDANIARLCGLSAEEQALLEGMSVPRTKDEHIPGLG